MMNWSLVRPVPTSFSANVTFTAAGLTQVRPNQLGLLITAGERMPFENPMDFQAISSLIRGSGLDTALCKVWMRFSADSLTWSGWIPTGLAHDNPQAYRDTMLISQMHTIDVGHRYVSLMIRFEALTPGLAAPFVSAIRLDCFQPGHITEINLELLSQQGYPGTSHTCTCPMPVFANRTQWNCPDGANPSCTVPQYATPSHLIVHHASSPATSTNWTAVVLAIWNYHTVTNGWCDIGYNWLIDPNGVIYEGRGGGNNVTGAHFCGQNNQTAGICLLGNLDQNQPTAAALYSLQALLTWKACDSGLDPIATVKHTPSGLTIPVISGHQDGCSTSCPGQHLYARLGTIRQGVDSLLNLCQAALGLDDDLPWTLSMFPNPARREITLLQQAPFAPGTRVQLFSLTGQEVLRHQVQTPTTELTLVLPATLTPGMYRLQVGDGDHTRTQSLILQE
ncbi:MAG: N-acetylmuramoyl-L-alanine amidase [Bacteroidia bacterium]|nr:N-acetylmuramoyl-L-alanine amidase [Bacteroidia bacterium]